MNSSQTSPPTPSLPDSPARLASLALPALAGKSFLDIGCHEGYYCGYAFFEGASKIVGLDRDGRALAKARAKFPQCAFIENAWEDPDAALDRYSEFDVILYISPAYSAAGQPHIVRQLVSRLAPDGTLVLETGIIPAAPDFPAQEVSDGWHRVQGDPGDRLFPSWAGIKAMLAFCAYKYIGPGTRHTGDPVPRHVFHIRRRLPLAILLMGAPGSGKTSIAARIAGEMPIISGDSLLCQMASDKEQFPGISEALGDDFNGQRLDRALLRIFAAGKGEEFARAVASSAGARDFIYDGYVPSLYQEAFRLSLRALGYRVSQLDTPAPPVSMNELSASSRREARKYELFLSALSFAQKMRGLR